MPQKKTKYELVADEDARREIFQKRKSSLFKKLNELEVLCGIDSCAIIYDESDDMPHFWPSFDVASKFVSKFNDLSLFEQQNHMVDLEGSLEKSVSKLNAELEREQKKNYALSIKVLLSKYIAGENVDEFNVINDDLKEIVSFLEKKIQLVSERITIVNHCSLSTSLEKDDAERGSHCGKGK